MMSNRPENMNTKNDKPATPGERDYGIEPHGNILLDEPSLYLNQEISWLKFNERILEEANDPANPLLERIKFLAIGGGNLDEFFMVRISGLKQQEREGGVRQTPPNGMTPAELLDAACSQVGELARAWTTCWNDGLLPALREQGILLHTMGSVSSFQRTALADYFRNNVLPAITPMAFDFARPFPFISGLALNLFVTLSDPGGQEHFARVKIPTRLYSRFISIPPNENTDSSRHSHLILIEDFVAAHLQYLFPGFQVTGAYPFRVTRDAEIKVAPDDGSDLLAAVEESVETRRMGLAVRLEVSASMPANIRRLLQRKLGLTAQDVYEIDGPLSFIDFWDLLSIDRSDLRDMPFTPFTPPALDDEQMIFERLKAGDVLLYHPYDNFQSVVNFISQAATDPDVLAIKITLYRIDQNSPVIQALHRARINGKQVTAVVELKAKFDEKNNITFARALEKAGVHVIYGHERLKVHAKICLVVRRESKGIVRYVHISSGNYNAVTSRIYGDIGYITSDAGIGEDATMLFNSLTGYAAGSQYRSLLVAPADLKTGILDRIEREILLQEEGTGGYIGIKVNGLIDPEIIQALYRASQAGVRVDLNVRGLCILKPAVPGISENIRVISIVSRFLEHARIYHFQNGGEDEVLIGSSDLMPRNLRRRVEILLPVPDCRLRRHLIKILSLHLADNVHARMLRPDGTYVRIEPGPQDQPLDSQRWLIEHRGFWHGD